MSVFPESTQNLIIMTFVVGCGNLEQRNVNEASMSMNHYLVIVSYLWMSGTKQERAD